MRTLIRNGRVVLDRALLDTDLLVDEGRIQALGRFDPEGADQVLDAQGCFVLPGFIDFHTHVDDRIGPFYLADTYESATRNALANGITTLCTFVTQGPDQTLGSALAAAQAKAAGHTHCDVLWHLTPTAFGPGDLKALEACVAAGYKTLKLYTTYKAAGIFASYQRIEELFERLTPLGARFLIHCEDDGIIAGLEPSGFDLASPLTHARLRPETAEVTAIERVLTLALAHRAPLHVVHVSTVAGAEKLARSRALGDVSFETCPQYLFLDETYLAREDGHRWLCSPPLRRDRAHFRELIRQGSADILATDHCPFSRQDKDSWDGTDLRAVPNGLPGVGALPHLAWKLWEGDADQAAIRLATHLSLNPAQRAGIADRKGSLEPGRDADIVILDPRGPERPLQSTLADSWEPYPGFTSPLAFRQVLLRGQACQADGIPAGRPLQPDATSLF